jgi:hypothetical protein
VASQSWYQATFRNPLPIFLSRSRKLSSDIAIFVVWGAFSGGRYGSNLPVQVLLGLASAVTLGSKSPRTRGHISLPRLRRFPFCRLLRLAGLLWRDSNPPPNGGVFFRVGVGTCERLSVEHLLLWGRPSGPRPDFKFSLV